MLTPVLNEERHIARTVAAMRRQRTSGRLEFLLVDGGSSDGTRAILADLAAQDARVRVLENPRRTTPSGLNVGLAHARGRWEALPPLPLELDEKQQSVAHCWTSNILLFSYIASRDRRQ